MRRNNRRRVTYRPSKSQAVFGGIMGAIFVVIGLVVVIPTFGPFGILWTLMALCGTVYTFYTAFGKKYQGPEIHIEDEASGSFFTPETQPEGEEDPAKRLERLRALYDQRLITQEEYEAKRKEIVKEL